ncbi:MAG: hypothetical protein WCJ30_17540 [Deltaproteobacteria bacterium]
MAFGDGMTEHGTESSQVAVRVLAKSLFKELKRAGYARGEMVAFASELLALVTTEIKTSGDERASS